MTQVESTADPVRLSFLRAVMEEAGLDYAVFDAHAGATWPGAFPSRMMVADGQAWIARRAIAKADAEVAGTESSPPEATV